VPSTIVEHAPKDRDETTKARDKPFLRSIFRFHQTYQFGRFQTHFDQLSNRYLLNPTHAIRPKLLDGLKFVMLNDYFLAGYPIGVIRSLFSDPAFNALGKYFSLKFGKDA
jgi:hypothetical protein